MKKILIYVLSSMITLSCFASTKNVVPGIDGEGSIGTLTNRWSAGYFKDVYILNGINVTNFIVSGTNFGGQDVINWNNNIIIATWASNQVVIFNGLTNGWGRWLQESNLYYKASNPSNYVNASITNGLLPSVATNGWTVSTHLNWLTNFIELDPVWSSVSNSVIQGAALGATSLQSFTNHTQSYTTITGAGTAITNNTADFATAAQGTLADNALPKVTWTNWLGTNTYVKVQTNQAYVDQAGTAAVANAISPSLVLSNDMLGLQS